MISYSNYQEVVSETDKLSKNNLGFIVLGLVGEVGDLLSLIKKEQRDSLIVNTLEEHLQEELGDILWYITSIINREGINIDTVVFNAIDKLHREGVIPSTLVLKNLNLLDSYSTGNNLNIDPLGISLQLAQSLGELVSLYTYSEPISEEVKVNVTSNFIYKLLLFCFAKKISILKSINFNLDKINSRWPEKKLYPQPFDSEYGEYEKFPDKLSFLFKEVDVNGKKYVIQQCHGVTIGDRLTDNKKDKDDYRFHDVFHICYAVHLGWSPVLRALLHLKRKSKASTDENQDGARAVLIEEGISTFIFSRALKQSLFKGVERFDYDLLKFIQQFVRGYEVDSCSLWQWEKAIINGYKIFCKLQEKREGLIIADFKNHEVIFEEIKSDK